MLGIHRPIISAKAFIEIDRIATIAAKEYLFPFQIICGNFGLLSY